MTDPIDDLLARLRPAWHSEAACRGAGADRFIVSTARETIDAKKICAVCPVTAQCLNYALADPALKGVWGGLSSRDRARTRAASPSLLSPNGDIPEPRQRLSGSLPPRQAPVTPRLVEFFAAQNSPGGCGGLSPRKAPAAPFEPLRANPGTSRETSACCSGSPTAQARKKDLPAIPFEPQERRSA